MVVVVTGYWGLQAARVASWTRFRSPRDPVYDAWMVDQLFERVDALGAVGTRILWLTAPCPGPDHMRPALRGFPAVQPEQFRSLNRVLLPRVRAARPDRVEIVDLAARVCPQQGFMHGSG